MSKYQTLTRINISNYTHDAQTNKKRAFCNYFTECNTMELRNNPTQDASIIEDLKVPTLKPRNQKLMGSIYEDFKSSKGIKVINNGYKATGINEVVEKVKNGVDSSLDPLVDFFIRENISELFLRPC